jgi:serine/threonine protein kinase
MRVRLEGAPPPTDSQLLHAALEGEDGVLDRGGVVRAVAGTPFGCCGCGRDLGIHAVSDGRAAELPDAIYICRACAAAQQMPALAGRHLGEFSLLHPLGRGGMGVVYKAVHDATRRICAVKHLHPSAATDERARRTFEREIDVQSAVLHPNLVRVLGRGESGGCFYVAVEFLAGGDVGRLVSKVLQGPLPPALACRIILQVLAGLEALHEAGFVHRDLKPTNFMLSRPHDDPETVAKITDYGLAKSYDYTRAGEAGGSLLFMPPEQILNFRFVTPAADVYAVGVSLYFLLTGKHSVELAVPGEAAGGRRRNPIELILEEPPMPVRQRDPALPPRVAAVVDRAVQKELAARFATATAMRVLLQDAAAEDGLL